MMERGEGIAASGCVSAKEQSQGRVRLVRKPLALKEQWVMGGRCHLRAVSTRGSSPSLQKAKLELLHFFQFFKKFIYLFIFGCVGSWLLRAGFLYLRRAGATLHGSMQTSHCGGFSCCRARALGVWASAVVVRGLSSCGTRA